MAQGFFDIGEPAEIAPGDGEHGFGAQQPQLCHECRLVVVSGGAGKALLNVGDPLALPQHAAAVQVEQPGRSPLQLLGDEIAQRQNRNGLCPQQAVERRFDLLAQGLPARFTAGLQVVVEAGAEMTGRHGGVCATERYKPDDSSACTGAGLSL